MSTRSDLLCMICDKILNKPVTLPCSCTMCQIHVNEFCKKHKKISIACQSCTKEIYIPEQGFEINKIIKNLIEKDVHLSKKEKEIKKSTTKALNELERLFAEFKCKESEFELTNFEHFATIKRNIDLRRESLKLKIDLIAAEMIRKAEASAEAFKQRLLLNQFKGPAIDFEHEQLHLHDIFRSHNIAIDQIRAYQLEQQTKISDIQAKLGHFEAMKEELNACTFYDSFNFECDHFGMLSLSDNESKHLVTCSGNDINIFDMASDEPIKTLTGHSRHVFYCNSKYIS